MLIMLYSLVIATRPLLGVLLDMLVFVAHLAIRFVAAVERIADAMETRGG